MPEQLQPTEYVVGQKDEETGYCWLLGLDGEHDADDQNIEIARRFSLLEQAEAAAKEHNAAVFEIVDDTTWPAMLEEIA